MGADTFDLGLLLRYKVLERLEVVILLPTLVDVEAGKGGKDVSEGPELEAGQDELQDRSELLDVACGAGREGGELSKEGGVSEYGGGRRAAATGPAELTRCS